MKESSQKPQASEPTGDESSAVSTLDLIWRILSGRRYAVLESDLPDIAQEAALRLWKWRNRHTEKASGLTKSEWDSFTAKTAHNEINRYLSNQLGGLEVPLEEAASLAAETPDGHEDRDMSSMIPNVWQEICSLTLYQRRALLLGAPELVVYLVHLGISEQAVVAALEISKEDWPQIYKRLPLSGTEIASIARSSETLSEPEAEMRAIRKARFDARKKLGRLKK